MSDLKAYVVGQLIELKDGRTATVRFTGQTSFAAGDWIGVELDDASGKNDGSVQGQRFFDCEQGHGMFLRPTGVGRIIEQPATKPKPTAKPSAPSTTAKARTAAGRPSISSAVSRPGGVDPAAKRRETMNAASPTPVRNPPPSHSRTPSKLASRPSTASATPRTTTTTTRSTATSRNPATPSTARTTATNSRTSLAADTRTTSTSSSATPSARQAAPRQSLVSRAGQPLNARAPVSHAPATSVASRTSSISTASPKKPSAPAVVPRPAAHARKENSQASVRSSDLDENPPEHDGDEESGEPEEDARTEKDGENLSSPQTDGNGADTISEAGTEQDAEERTVTRSERPVVKAPVRAAVSSRQIADLETKISLLEKTRNEDRDKLKSLEKMRDKIQTERDRFESIIQKLQTKYQPQQQEITELKKQLKEKEQKLSEAEDAHGGTDEDLEMAYLDKEMAEEMAETLKLEVDTIKQKLEELQLEVEVLREENEELGKDVSPEERKQTSWLHLERENDRMREAIIRLRDMSMDTEAELKESIAAQDEELQALRSLKDKHEEAQEKQKQTETVVEDLRAQLETALGAEEMIEELTERNMSLAEQMEDLKMNIKDLEDLRELNDELEHNHVEAEKQMLEELDFKDSILAEQQRRAMEQEQKIVEREYAITKFRELVTNLQSGIEEMRSSKQITEAEAEELNSRSRAMADLNMRLQTSAAKTQSNTVDLELRRLEAQEAVEHLSIVQMFLPDSFATERDSVLAYLRFKRVAAKARLLHASIKDKLSTATAAQGPDNVFTFCDILDKLIWISSMCDRLSNNISASSLDRFARYESALYELDPVERGLNAYIESFKRGDMKEENVSEELQRSVALLSHLSEVHIPEDDLEAYADDILVKAALIQSYLENTAASLSFVQTLIPDGEDQDGELDSLDLFKRQVDGLIGHSRSAKVVAGKAFAALTELKDRSMALGQGQSEEQFEQTQHAVQIITTMSRQLGMVIRKSLDLEPDADDVSPRSAIRTAISQFAATIGDSSDPVPAFTSKLQGASTQLSAILSLTSDLSIAVEFERPPPPWIQRSEELKSSKALSISAEEEIQRLRDSVHERATQLRIRDQTLEEQSVKIELLESRTRDANAKANRITELQRLLEDGKSREKQLEDAIDKKFHEIDSLVRERDRWRQEAHERKPSNEQNDAGDGDSRGSERAVATAREMDALRTEIEGLQGAVRYLRDDNARQSFAKIDMAWLAEPLPGAAKVPTEAERRHNDLRREGTDLCVMFIDAMANAQLIDLTSLPKNKLEWRPAKEKAAWRVAKQGEAWEEWLAHRDGFVAAAREELEGQAEGLIRGTTTLREAVAT
ncbi:hypothetical protein FH972_023412 [Carpinus fangiana]|uniref:CAP-Gly domain-containing protein n=1 Tax=Carpinus fangiana TaxID=176857 RepID=A0A5N6KV50_9ROSI|nr:hypothetical protein FH972_023412 [Carpinus fangiana]